MTTKKIEDNVFLISMIVVAGTALNIIGKGLADSTSAPLWLDAFGTVMSAYLLGPYAGALTGLAGNLIYGVYAHNALVYGITSVVIGVIVGFAARKGRFETFFGIMCTSTVVALFSVFISTPLNIFLYEGMTGNVWGDGVIGFIIERTGHPLFAYFLGEFYLDFVDKVLTLILFAGVIRIVRAFRKLGKGRKHAAEKSVARILFLVMVLSILPDPMVADAASAGVEDWGKDDDKLYSYVQTVYSSKNGLPCGEANDVAGTPDGILWIGTYAGLYRYNGHEFTFMDYDSVKNVNCLYVDQEGRVWIGTNDNGLSLCINEKIYNVVDRRSGLPSNSIRSIVASSDGYFYVGTSDKMQVMELNGGLKILETIPEVIYAHDLAADKNGNVVAVTYTGEMYLLRDRKVVKKLVSKEHGSIFSSSAFDEKGLLYVGRSDGRISVYDISRDTFALKKNYDLSEISGINSLHVSETGFIYACGERGIGYLTPEGKTGFAHPNKFQSSIDRMTEDYQGNLWFASSRQGVLRMSKSPFYDFYGAAGVESGVVNSVTRWQNRLYVGTDRGLDCIDERTGQFYSDEMIERFAGNRIRCVYTDGRDCLWICTYGKGLYQLEKNGSIQEYNASNGLFSDWVRLVTELKDGRIAASGDAGLLILKNGTVERLYSMEELSLSAMILTLQETRDGVILMGSDGDGIVGLKDGKKVLRLTEEDGLSSGVILRIRETAAGDGWYLVASNGISYMDKDYQVRDIVGFPYSNNYDIETTPEGTCFVLGSAGIFVVKEEDLLAGTSGANYELLDSSRGLEFSLTVNSHNLRTADGKLYLSGDDGIYGLNLYNYGSLQKSYRMKLSYVSVDGLEYPVERGMDILIPRETERVTFNPEIINYTLEDPYIRYQLKGVDSEEITLPLSSFTGVTYAGLHSGDNEFHIAVLDGMGEVMEESTYHIVRESALWDHWWFLLYLFSVGALTIMWFTWLIARTQMKRTYDIQQRELKVAQQQVQMGNETILAIARTVDAKDENTSQHSQRVSEYSVMLAREMGYSEEECEDLRKAALLHDIGKIGIPDSILNKPSRLTEEEYAVMKTHVTRGAEILKDFTVVNHAADGAKYHHERYDGTGYPDGLKGQDIPLYGRIIGVADAFDAMTQNRVYRKKLSKDYVLGELKRCSGTQFDPEIAGIMIRLVEEGKVLQEDGEGAAK